MYTMENNENDYLMLSGIQHFQFCQRQWALIHIEQQWEENLKTIEGQYVHKKTDQPFIREKRKNKIIVRSMPIVSHELKVTGICDVVEFIQNDQGIELQNGTGKYLPVPIEYKRGRPKKGDEDILQLVAQAICLEEMLLCEVNKGYIFYNETRRRFEVEITPSLRDKVTKTLKLMRSYYDRKHTPKVKTGKHCESCSLKNVCLPKLNKPISVRSYMERYI